MSRNTLVKGRLRRPEAKLSLGLRLDQMPEGLGELTTLERVDFRDNPWLSKLRLASKSIKSLVKSLDFIWFPALLWIIRAVSIYFDFQEPESSLRSNNSRDPGWFTLSVLQHMGCDCGLRVPAVPSELDLSGRQLRGRAQWLSRCDILLRPIGRCLESA